MTRGDKMESIKCLIRNREGRKVGYEIENKYNDQKIPTNIADINTNIEIIILKMNRELGTCGLITFVLPISEGDLF